MRLKGTGILWYTDNAEAMLALRAAALTERWNETLEHVRETMASDRRLDWKWQAPDMPEELKSGKLIKPPETQPESTQQPTPKAA